MIVALVLIAASAAALYGPHVIRGGWYYDDWAVASNLTFGSADGAKGVLEASFAATHRPGAAVVRAALYGIGGSGQSSYLLAGVGLVALQCSLFYLALRLLGIRVVVAAAATALLLGAPWIDATRLWTAAFTQLFGVTLYLGGVVAALIGLRRGSKAIAWHTAALGLYACACLTFELLAPLVPLTALLYLRFDARGALKRWPFDCAAAATSLAVIASAGHEERDANLSLSHLLDRGEQVLSAAFQVFGESLPAESLLAGPLGLAAAIVAAVGIGTAVRDPGTARALRHWAIVAGAGLIFGLAGLVLLLPADAYYVPRVEGIGDRVSVVAALGHVVLLTALAWLVATGLATAARRSRFAAPLALGIVAVTASSFAVTELRHQDSWAASWRLSQRVVDSVRASVGPEVPSGSSIVTFGHPMFVRGDVPVFAPSTALFDGTSDLDGALRLLYRDETVRGFVFLPGFRCERAGLRPPHAPVYRSRGPRLPYGKLWFVDSGRYTATRIPTRRACERALGAMGHLVPPASAETA